MHAKELLVKTVRVAKATRMQGCLNTASAFEDIAETLMDLIEFETNDASNLAPHQAMDAHDSNSSNLLIKKK